MSQNQRLLSYLKTHKRGITQLEAFNKLGICRLSERIREIEGVGRGWTKRVAYKGRIYYRSERVKTRYGYANVMRYRLA